jgi:uncharacterized protein with HEPN domain
LYILTILESIEKINIYAQPYKSAEEIFESNDQLSYNAVCHLLLAIGEESKKIEDTVKEEIAIVSWDVVAGLRNRLAHDYRGIDPNLVYHIVTNELEPFKQACISLLKIVSIQKSDLKKLVKTFWYRHLGYLNQFI